MKTRTHERRPQPGPEGLGTWLVRCQRHCGLLFLGVGTQTAGFGDDRSGRGWEGLAIVRLAGLTLGGWRQDLQPAKLDQTGVGAIVEVLQGHLCTCLAAKTGSKEKRAQVRGRRSLPAPGT
jgi:hypothetical protein